MSGNAGRPSKNDPALSLVRDTSPEGGLQQKASFKLCGCGLVATTTPCQGVDHRFESDLPLTIPGSENLSHPQGWLVLVFVLGISMGCE